MKVQSTNSRNAGQMEPFLEMLDVVVGLIY